MYNEFEAWLDAALSVDMPDDIVAFNFNLYEDGDDLWSIELIGASRFDAEDPDWACDQVFTNREEPFEWSAETDWEEVLETMTVYVEKYLEEGKYADMLKSYDAVGIGFVDGDITIVYVNDEISSC
jgi:shikimate kinase